MKILLIINALREIFYRYWDLLTAPKYSIGNRILYSTGCYSYEQSNKHLIYCVHIEGLHVPSVIYRNIEYFINHKYNVTLVVSFSNSSLNDIAYIFNKSLLKFKLIIRSNIGKDFIALADVCNFLDFSSINFLVFMNDSIVGPLYFSDFISEIESIDGDFIGITESYGPAYHLQSSFLIFNGSKSISYLVRFFVENYKIYKSRSNIIKYGEVGLTSYMIAKGLKTQVYLPIYKLLKNSSYKGAVYRCNPQHHFGVQLLTELNFPYIKRELLSKNPANLDISWKKIELKIAESGLRLLMESLRSRP